MLVTGVCDGGALGWDPRPHSPRRTREGGTPGLGAMRAHFRRTPPPTSSMYSPLLVSIQAAMNSLPAQVLPV